jgi:hypothetical protein
MSAVVRYQGADSILQCFPGTSPASSPLYTLPKQMINIFVSRPTVIETAFESAYSDFEKFLIGNSIRCRRLGGGDYSRKAPLKAVFQIIDECRGAIILGFPQVTMRHEVRRSMKTQNDWGYVFPTPWNQIEGALAYRAETPVLVIAHHGVEGGVFDHGVTGEGVIHLDLSSPDWFQSPQFEQPFFDWLTEVRTKTKAETP